MLVKKNYLRENLLNFLENALDCKITAVNLKTFHNLFNPKALEQDILPSMIVKIVHFVHKYKACCASKNEWGQKECAAKLRNYVIRKPKGSYNFLE